MALFALYPGLSYAQRPDTDRMRQMEEDLRRLQQDLDAIKLERSKEKEEAAKHPSKFPWGIEIIGSVTLRYDITEVEDRQDLLLEDNEVEGLRSRNRLGFYYYPDGPVVGGLRLTTGGDPNPTSPFGRPGDAFRSKSFRLDEYYFTIRPLKFFDDRPFAEHPFHVELLVGKPHNPIWTGERGGFVSELVWDKDVNPEGLALKLSTHKLGPVGVDFLTSYYIVEQLDDLRFQGFTKDTYLITAQLRLKFEPTPDIGGSIAFTFYDWENLNAGARSPVFDPANVVVTPGQRAFLLRPGFQITNNTRDLGVGAVGFLESDFQVIDLAGQVYFGLPVPSLRPEIFLYGEYINNLSVDNEEQGYGITIGLRGGGKDLALNPFMLWFTYRDVDQDATLATFADSDLGAGTGYRGFSVGGTYRVHRNLQFEVKYYDYEGFPFKLNSVQRWFFDAVFSF
jgi:hypothetical protein